MLIVQEILSHRLVYWGQVLAVSAPRSKKLDQSVLSTLKNVILERSVGQDSDRRHGLDNRGLDARLLGHETCQGLEVASTAVILRFAFHTLGEPLQGRKTLDAEAGAEVTMSISIDFGDQDLVLLACESLAQLRIDLQSGMMTFNAELVKGSVCRGKGWWSSTPFPYRGKKRKANRSSRRRQSGEGLLTGSRF